MKLEPYFVLFSIFLPLFAVNGYRILGLFPLPGRSHFNVNNAIMKSLAAAGHQVMVVTPFADQPPTANYTKIDFSDEAPFVENQFSLKDFSDMPVYEMMNNLTEMEKSICAMLMKRPEIQKMFQSKEKLFDAIFFEVLGLYECLSPLAEKWKIPTIGTLTATSWNVPEHTIGNPRFPAVIHFEIGQVWDLSTIYGRFMNTLKHIWSDMVISYMIWRKGNEFYDAHADVLAPYSGYRKIKPSLIFFNSHFSILPRAQNPNSIEIGGIHVPPVKPLPSKIQEFIEGAESGVIVFTLGSVVRASTVPNETLLAFKDAFQVIPQRVIWKYEDEMDDIPENVLLLPWMPQRDILAHHNVKAVISHCGLSGFNEIIHSEKPMIATPLLGDQMHNAKIFEENGAGIILNIKELNKEIILSALNSIINDTRYTLNMKNLARRFKDRPMSPEETVVYWTDYVIKYEGAPHMQTPASKLYWFQYLLVDILTCILVILIFGLYVLKWVLKNIKISFSKLCNNDDINSNKKMS